MKLRKKKTNCIPQTIQIIVQGNNRLDSSVVIRDSMIDADKSRSQRFKLCN